MTEFLQTLVAGIGQGSLDALLALGIVLVYRTTGVLNLAQAATGTFAAFVAFSISQGRPVGVAILASLLVGAALGVGTFRVVEGIEARHQTLAATVATLAAGILITQSIRVFWGTTVSQAPFPQVFDLSSSVQVGSVTIAQLQLASIVVALGLAVLLGAALRWTRIGTMTRAISDNAPAAQLCGGNVWPLLAGVWAVSGVLAAVAGFFEAQIGFFPGFLDPYFVPALIAAVLGGLRSLSGAFGGAIFLECAKDIFQSYAPSTYEPYAQTFLLLVLIGVLVIAPRRWLSQGTRRLV